MPAKGFVQASMVLFVLALIQAGSSPSTSSAATPRPDSVRVFMTGDELRELCMAYKETLNNNYKFKASEARAKEFQLGVLIGYVSGVYDANAESFLTPTSLSREQLVAIVTKHVLDHPEEWHLPGRHIVEGAIEDFVRSTRAGSGRVTK